MKLIEKTYGVNNMSFEKRLQRSIAKKEKDIEKEKKKIEVLKEKLDIHIYLDESIIDVENAIKKHLEAIKKLRFYSKNLREIKRIVRKNVNTSTKERRR